MGIKGYNVWSSAKAEKTEDNVKLIEANFAYKNPLIYKLMVERYSAMVAEGETELAEEMLTWTASDWIRSFDGEGKIDTILISGFYDIDEQLPEILPYLPLELKEAIEFAMNNRENDYEIVIPFDRNYQPTSELPSPDDVRWVGVIYCYL